MNLFTKTMRSDGIGRWDTPSKDISHTIKGMNGVGRLFKLKQLESHYLAKSAAAASWTERVDAGRYLSIIRELLKCTQ